MTTTPHFHSYFASTSESMKQSILYHLKFSLAHDVQSATKRDWWLATSKAVHERIIERMIATQAVHNQQDVRRVYYLSLEFLMGRLFSNGVYNAGIFKETEIALKELGLDMDELRGEEYDMGLGNGGLGRLAACCLDRGNRRRDVPSRRCPGPCRIPPRVTRPYRGPVPSARSRFP